MNDMPQNSQPRAERKTLRWLVVDDDVASETVQIEKIRTALAERGVELDYTVMPTAADALDYLRTRQNESPAALPDAILCDYVLRDQQSGLEALTDLKQWMEREAPADQTCDYVMITGSSERVQRIVDQTMPSANVHVLHKGALLAHVAEAISLGETASEDRGLHILLQHIARVTGLSLEHIQQEHAEAVAARQEKMTGGELLVSDMLQMEELYDPARAGELVSALDLAELEAGMSPQLAQGCTDYLRFTQSAGQAMHGHAAFTADDVERLRREGKQPILILSRYDPSAMYLLDKVAGVICLGEGSSHLRIQCETLGKPGVFDIETVAIGNQNVATARLVEMDGAPALQDCMHAALAAQRTAPADVPSEVQYEGKHSGLSLKAGDPLTIDPARREIGGGHVPLTAPKYGDAINRDLFLMYTRLLDNVSQREGGVFSIKINADSKEQLARSESLWVPIGLMRTENMFLGDDLDIVKQAVLNPTPETLAAFKQTQQDKLRNLLTEDVSNATIRLLDLSADFLTEEESAALAARTGEPNRRGMQLARITPGLYRAQLEAICELYKEDGFHGPVYILVPQVESAEEMREIRQEVDALVRTHGLLHEDGTPKVRIGAMLESTRSCQPEEAAKIAQECDFVRFGTNDLTQSVTGLDRANITQSIAWSQAQGYGDRSPFLHLCEPVLTAMRTAVDAMRQVNPTLDIGCCGDQVKQLDSMRECLRMGLDNVSVPADPRYIGLRYMQLTQEQLRAQQAQAPKAIVSEGVLAPRPRYKEGP